MRSGSKLRDQILKEMESYFGEDVKRIAHACKVLEYSDKIIKDEPGDKEIVEAAAILHDIGIREAERKHGSTAGKFQQIEGPPIAKHILKKIGFPEKKLKEVLDIIAHHHTPGVINTQNFKILYDSDWLVNLEDEHDLSDRDKLWSLIEKIFLTPAGKATARKLYLG
jgi:HD superfamily phosphodiesterase